MNYYFMIINKPTFLITKVFNINDIHIGLTGTISYL